MLRKLNRLKSKTVKRKSNFWCYGCDANRISTLKTKCGYCGFRHKSKKIKGLLEEYP